MIVLTRADVVDMLRGREKEVLDAVESAYRTHAAGDTAVPHSVFLRPPRDPRSRIIGLPAYLGGEQPLAGMKWIASFPANIDAGRERASASIILNSLDTGEPLALLEGSVVSARRTAASAAVAARLLAADTDEAGVALIGCGVINFEVLRFLAHVHPRLAEVALYDLKPERAAAFAGRCARELPGLPVHVAPSLHAALAGCSLVSMATTATTPHLDSRLMEPGTLVLHISLRDLLPAAILEAVNVVDDADHVCREGTSLHLAEQKVGHRGFISCAVGELIASGRDPGRVTVFSPFGLGVLDLAVAGIVLRHAQHANRGIHIENFLGEG